MKVINAISDVLSAWEDAKAQATRAADLKAERKTLGLVLPSPPPELLAMKRSFEGLYGIKLRDEDTPGRHYLGAKLQQIQDNDPQFELLTEVTTKADGESETLSADLDESGRVKVRKGTVREVKMPRNPEELRHRYKVIGYSWLFAS